MTGLIIKDFLFMKAQAKALAFIFIFFTVLSFVNRSTFFLLIMCSVLAIPTAATLSAYDESVKWNRFACSLPYTRAQIAASRYISVIIVTVSVSIIAFFICLAQILIFHDTNINETIFMLIGSLSIAFLSLSIVMPLFIKFGVEKARLLMMVFLVLPSILVMVIGNTDTMNFLNSMSKIPPVLVLLTIVVFIALCLYISYLISLKLFSKKDL